MTLMDGTYTLCPIKRLTLSYESRHRLSLDLQSEVCFLRMEEYTDRLKTEANFKF